MLTSLANHKPSHILQKKQRDALLIAIHHKPCRFVCTVGVDHPANLHLPLLALHNTALVCHNPNTPPIHPSIARNESLPVALLVLHKRLRINNRLQHRHHIVRFCTIVGNLLRKPCRIVRWCNRLVPRKSGHIKRTQVFHKPSHRLECFSIILHLIIGNSANLCMRSRASECFVVDLFSNRSLHEVTTRQKHASRPIHNQRFITHDGQIRTASHTTSHNGSDLWDSHAAHHRIVPENTPKMLLIGENLILHGQKYACRIHQVEYGEMILHSDLLCTQILLGRHRKPRSCFHGSVVCHNHAISAGNSPNPRNHPRRRTSSLLCIHVPGRPQTNLIKHSPVIQKKIDPFPRCHFPPLMLLFDPFFAAPLPNLLLRRPKQRNLLLHPISHINSNYFFVTVVR